jgi:hypothetical protein
MNSALFAASTASRTVASRPASPRHDLYTGIHKGLRSFMAQTLVRLGRIDVADATDRDEALDQLEQLLCFCAVHLRHENTFIHTAIEARQPAGTTKVAEEHVEHGESIAALRAEAAALRSAPEYAAAALALRLYRHLALFVAENLQHMHVEETAHNAVLWARYTDDELRAIHDEIVASIPPDQMLFAARWLIPAMSPVERVGMMAGMKAHAPAPAFEAVLATVRPHLTELEWAKLEKALG